MLVSRQQPVTTIRPCLTPQMVLSSSQSVATWAITRFSSRQPPGLSLLESSVFDTHILGPCVMKELNIILFTLILAIFVSCQADLNPGDAFPSAPVTKSDDSSSIVDTLRLSKEDALKIVEPITSKYPDRWVDISNDIIPAGTSIAYNPLGHIREVDDLKYYNSPNFDAWLLVIEGDLSIMGIQPITHIFVNVVTGEYITVELNGRAIIEWDSSRYVFEYPAEDGTLEVRDYSLPPERSSSHGKYAVIYHGLFT